MNNIPEITSNIEKLTADDKAMVDVYPEEAFDYSAGLREYFRNCVLEEHSEVLVIKEYKEIL